MTPLVDRVLSSFRRHLGDRPSAGVVAISGGPDSVALALIAKQLLDRGVLSKVVLAHLNHQLRGAESDADEAFVIDLAARWKLPVVTEAVDVAELASSARSTGLRPVRGRSDEDLVVDRSPSHGSQTRATGGPHRNLEATARDVRYAWLTQVARGENATWIATGHTTDDQAETVLFHFLRGAGLTGLSGIADVRPLAAGVALLRPLLDVRRAELLEMLAAADVRFRTDTSNDDPRFTRNRLRREIIPLLEREINPGLVDVLARTAQQAHECQAAVTAIAAMNLICVEMPRADDVLVFSRSKLSELTPFWIRETFRLVWRREGWPMGEMDAGDWRRLERLVDGSLSAHDFPGGVHGRGQRHVVQLWPASRAASAAGSSLATTKSPRNGEPGA